MNGLFCFQRSAKKDYHIFYPCSEYFDVLGGFTVLTLPAYETQSVVAPSSSPSYARLKTPLPLGA